MYICLQANGVDGTEFENLVAAFRTQVNRYSTHLSTLAVTALAVYPCATPAGMLPRVLSPWQQVTHVGLLLQGQVASGGLSFDPCCLEDFDMMQVLGTGSFGRVTLSKHRESETVCAVKALSKAHMLKNQQVSSQKGKQTQHSSALVVCVTRRQWAVWSAPAADICRWLA